MIIYDENKGKDVLPLENFLSLWTFLDFSISPALLKANGNSNKPMLFFQKAAKYAKPGSVSRTIT